jgi:hypothetical protein
MEDLNKDRLRTACDEVVANIDAKRNGLLSGVLYEQMQELVFKMAGSARHCLASNSTPASISSPLRAIQAFIMTTIEKTLKHDLIARLTAPTPNTERAHCMTCGRAVNAERAKLGGRHQFCSGCCMDAYDAGWSVYGTTIADYATRPVATRPRPNSVTKRSRKRRSDTGKPRKRGAASAAKNAEWTDGLSTNNGSKNLQRNQRSIDPISEAPNPLGAHPPVGTSRSIGFRGRPGCTQL